MPLLHLLSCKCLLHLHELATYLHDLGMRPAPLYCYLRPVIALLLPRELSLIFLLYLLDVTDLYFALLLTLDLGTLLTYFTYF